MAFAAWSYTVDDAFILARYAENLWAGRGYAMNPDRSSDGITGPLWLSTGLIASALGLGPVATAKAAGACFGLLAVLGTVRWAQASARGRYAGIATAVLLACLPDVGVWAVAGLETPLAMLAACALAWAALRRGEPAPVLAGLALSALAWLRPELALFGAVMLCALARRHRGAALRAALIACVAVAMLLAFRLASFGDWLPLSARAKPPQLTHGLAYAARSVALTTSLTGIVLAFVGAKSGARRDLWLGAALLAHLIAVALAGGDWMPGSRLLVPVLPLYALLAARGAERIARRRPRLAVTALVLTCALPLVDLVTRIPELHASAESREGPGRALARELRAHSKIVALVDVGLLAYASGVNVVDLGGITDPEIARLPGAHLDKRIDEALLRSRAPDTIVLHDRRREPRIDDAGHLIDLDGYPVERRVAKLRWVRSEFRVVAVVAYAPGYQYVVLRR